MRRFITQTGVATVLCLAVSVPAVAAQAAPRPGTPQTGLPRAGDDGKNSLKAAKSEVDRLFADAGRITQQYEAARRAVRHQQTRIERLAGQVRDQQRRVTALRGSLGRMAALQYRNGGDAAFDPTTQFMLSDDPGDFMDRLYLAGRGERAAGQLLERTQRAEEGLRAEKARAGRAKLELDHELYVQRQAKRTLESKLLRAQDKLAKLRDRLAAQERARAAAQARARTSDKPAAGGADSADSTDSTGGAGSKRGSECVAWQSAVPFSMNGAEDAADGKPFVARRWRAPVTGYQLTSRFAQAGEHWGSLHTGLDFAVPEGRPVRSVGFGTVYELGCDGAFGNSVTVQHDDGYYTFYAHLSELDVRPGQRVFPGQHLGKAGTTGNSTGPHLHFEVRATPLFGSGIDPEPWLKAKGVTP
ncbi:murein hydrolase activator EnvC family protein [Streptomyces polyrhachis]|uniref:Murein hydrolase activator EnvC family protein n=1 Tax=Streptomyces polyrhachis TaxID=1282885 RepID=A0ABW2GIL4_9ACTN